MGILAIIMDLLRLIELLIKWLTKSNAANMTPVAKAHLAHFLAKTQHIKTLSEQLGVMPETDLAPPRPPSVEELASDS